MSEQDYYVAHFLQRYLEFERPAVYRQKMPNYLAETNVAQTNKTMAKALLRQSSQPSVAAKTQNKRQQQ